MSAIIAGKDCEVCGREYWMSFGHPDWYDDVMKRGLEASEQFTTYVKMAKSGLCPKCYAESTVEGWEEYEGKYEKEEYLVRTDCQGEESLTALPAMDHCFEIRM